VHAPQGARVYTLRALNASVQEAIAARMGGKEAWIEAEIAYIQEHRSGHLFLELVDQREGRIHAKAQAVIWRSAAEAIRAELGAEAPNVLRTGNAIQCRVSVDYHVVYGLKLHIQAVNLAFNLGRMALQKRATLEALRKAGLMELNASRPMPAVPQRILVVGASDSAGMRDFVRQLLHNAYGYRFALDLAQSRVQGEGAGQALAACVIGVGQMAPDVRPELVVLVRGGGAQLDLAAYNEQALAEAIARCPVPVLTGIGHDSDQSVADLVAHSACKTPTAAAAMLVDRAAHFEGRQREQLGRIVQAAVQRLEGERGKQDTRSEALDQRARLAVLPEARRLDARIQALGRSWTERVHRARKGLIQQSHVLRERSLWRVQQVEPKRLRKLGSGLRREAEQLSQEADRRLERARRMPLLAAYRMDHIRQSLEGRADRLRLLDPRSVLAKGYALIERDPAHRGAAWHVGEPLRIRLKDGRLDARVEGWRPEASKAEQHREKSDISDEVPFKEDHHKNQETAPGKDP
jgi:exodeoxyribonuclease VII large subunit